MSTRPAARRYECFSVQNVRLILEALAGQRVILNSFGIVRVRGVSDGGLAVESESGSLTIPLAIIRSIRLLAPGGLAGPELVVGEAGGTAAGT